MCIYSNSLKKNSRLQKILFQLLTHIDIVADTFYIYGIYIYGIYACRQIFHIFKAFGIYNSRNFVFNSSMFLILEVMLSWHQVINSWSPLIYFPLHLYY